MRHFARLPRILATMAFAAGLAQHLLAQEDLPPEFLRAHALVVRFLASSFDSREQNGAKGLPQSPGVSPNLPSPPPAAASAAGRPVAARPSSSSDLATPLWTTVARRYTVTGAPVAIRFSGENIVIVVQITPYDRGKQGLLVVAQGQVWSRGADGAISYHSAFESLEVGFGDPVYFFPLGLNPDGTTALKVEIAIDHFGDSPSIPDPPVSEQSVPGTQGR